MARFLPALLFLILPALPGTAQQADARLDTVTQELGQIVADLEAAQAQTEGLRSRLASLEALSAEHQTALRDQEALVARYRESVAALEAHDREALGLAETLNRQLEDERRLTSWLWPAVGVAAGAALVEAVLLVVLK